MFVVDNTTSIKYLQFSNIGKLSDNTIPDNLEILIQYNVPDIFNDIPKNVLVYRNKSHSHFVQPNFN